MLGFLAFYWWTSAIYGQSRPRRPLYMLEHDFDDLVNKTIVAWRGELQDCPMVESLRCESRGASQRR